jgi:putative transposase
VKKRFSEEQIIGFLREAESGLAVKELCRRHGFSEASYYLWRSKFGGMTVSEPSAYGNWRRRTRG